MEQQLSEKDKQKIINKKFPDNHHLVILDRVFDGKTRPCICDLNDRILFYMFDKSSPENTDIYVYDPENIEKIHIREVVSKAKTKGKGKLFSYQFHIQLEGAISGTIRMDALSMDVNMDNYESNWQIEYSERHSLGYQYRYSVYKKGQEVAHFRSVVLHQAPVYILDHTDESDRLFLIALFIIHSIFTNKKPQRNLKKADKLSRMKGLLGL